MNETGLIPPHADSYDTLNFVHTKCVSVYKRVGYTPLQVVKDIKPYLLPEEASVCTYVGRLDPMAEGWMHVLWNGDMEEKKRLVSLDKTYEIEVVLGIQTDTGDCLGLVVKNSDIKIDAESLHRYVQSFVGPFTYPYPAYSSPHIKKKLKDRKGDEENMPAAERSQKGNIFNIQEISSVCIDGQDLEHEIIQKIKQSKMDGDFRIDQILACWKDFFSLENKLGKKYVRLTLRVNCSSGTYMRTLAGQIGEKGESCGFALSIKRIGFGKVVHI